jgi:TPR repeat protein
MRHYVKLLRAALSALLMLTGLTVAAVAGSLEDAITAYDRGDYETTSRLLRPLAEEGYAVAQTSLGEMYAKGKGVPQDYAEAAKWYRLAADQGEPDAQVLLGLLYDEGAGVPQDYVQAHMWLSLAASRYSDSQRLKREVAATARNLIASKMTSAQVAEAQELARKWKPTPKQ